MKNLIKKMGVLLFFAIAISCNNDDAPAAIANPIADCLASSFLLSNPVVDVLNGQSKIIVTFNVKNSSSTNYSYSPAALAGKAIYSKMLVKTTDGTIIETKGVLLATELSAGATATVDILGNYSTGKTYESYTVELYCQ